MIEKKTTTEIFQAHRKVMNPVDTLPMNIYLESAKREWISVESLLPKLEEAFNKSQPISTKVALGRIIKEIKEK